MTVERWVLLRVRVAGSHFPILGVGTHCYAGVGDIIHVAPGDVVGLVLDGLAEVYVPGQPI